LKAESKAVEPNANALEGAAKNGVYFNNFGLRSNTVHIRPKKARPRLANPPNPPLSKGGEGGFLPITA